MNLDSLIHFLSVPGVHFTVNPGVHMANVSHGWSCDVLDWFLNWYVGYGVAYLVEWVASGVDV